MNKKLIVLLLFLVLMFSLSDALWVTSFKVPVVKASVSSDWYYSNMSYRVEHNIIGSPAGNQTNYQMEIVVANGTGTSNESVYYTTHVNQSDFDDVMFTWYNTTSGQEEEIDYWCEEVNSGSNATFWVEIPEVSNVTDNTIYIYYGNNNTATTSNVNATFIRVIDGNQPVVLALPMNEGSGNKTYDQSGNDNDGVLYSIPVEVNNCDNTTGWSGTSLSSESNDKVEGSVSVKDTITSPTAETDYDTSYTASGSWDWSSKKHMVFWLKCDRASTVFTDSRLVLVDASNREKWWDISFNADEWTRIMKTLGTSDGEDTGFDLSAVDKVVIRFTAADTTDFYKLIDYIQINENPQWVDGKFDQALTFDGENDRVEVPHHESLDITKNITIEAWIKANSLSSNPCVLSKGSGSNTQYWMDIRGDGTALAFGGYNTSGEPLYWERGYSFELGSWYHLVGIFDGEQIMIAINGSVGSLSNSGEWLSNTINVSIGTRAGDQFFDGVIDEVRIYNRALTVEEITDLYNYYSYVTPNYAGRVLVRKRVDPEPRHGTWGSEVLYVPVHDIAIVTVAPSSTEVIRGNSIKVLVEVQNEGTESETFNVTAHYDSNIIDTQTNISLKPRANKIVTLTWNTTDVFPGNYHIFAQVSTVPGETDTDDNIFADGTVKIIVDYPVAYFTHSPTNPFVNETVTFNATLSTPNGGDLINYIWDFDDGFHGNGIIVYHNYSKTRTYNVTLTVTDSENVNNTAWAAITASMHNVSITSVTPSINEIYQGQTINITIIIQNNGNLTENFNITIYTNTTTIQTQTVSNLAPTHQTTLTFIWNTAETSPGNYTIKAETSIAPEETYATQTITVHTPPSWYTPLITWLISIPLIVWVGISIPIILAALFWLGIITVEIEKPQEPAEEPQYQINKLLRPLAQKDKRFILLQQFLYQLREKNPPPETIEFLRNTLPIIIKAIIEPKEEKK